LPNTSDPGNELNVISPGLESNKPKSFTCPVQPLNARFFQRRDIASQNMSANLRAMETIVLCRRSLGSEFV
jgi:hypothetical protein